MKASYDGDLKRGRTPKCRWDKAYGYTPADWECVLTHCDSPTESPNTDSNYNYVWDNQVDAFPLGPNKKGASILSSPRFQDLDKLLVDEEVLKEEVSKENDVPEKENLKKRIHE